MNAPVSLANFVNFIIAIAMVVRLGAHHQRVGGKPLKRFIWFYISFAIFWLLWAAPEIFVTNPYSVMATNIMGYVMLYVTSAIMVQIPFLFSGRKSIGTVLCAIIITAGVVFLIGRLINLQPHIREIVGNRVYWRPVFAPWLRMMTGAAGGLAALTASIAFYYFGWRERVNRAIFMRSIYLGTGNATILCGAIVSFILSPTAGFAGVFAGSIFGAVGLFIMMHGIMREAQPQQIQNTAN